MLTFGPHHQLAVIIDLPVYMEFLVKERIVIKILVSFAKNELSRSKLLVVQNLFISHFSDDCQLRSPSQ